jgi:SAM-dependent methyltransferase
MSSPADFDHRRYAPATLRNRASIMAVLERILPAAGTVLEIASGSGEHAVHFAAAFAQLRWQPSDPDASARASIAAWRAEAGLDNLAAPIELDAAAPDWPIERTNAVLAINMVHIAPWDAALGLVAGAARLLAPGAPLYLYGPFRRAGHAFAPSNAEFDQSLRQRNPQWGVRSLEDVEGIAAAAGFTLAEIVEMPANNLSLVFRRN